MEQTMESCPENLDENLYTCLFSYLSVGVDLDDLIFSGEDWQLSER